MSKRGYIRLLSFTLAVIIGLAAYGGINQYAASVYRARLENTYQHSLNELSENLDSIETNLTKSVYSGSDSMLTQLSSDLFAECSEAKDALSRLPVEQMNLGSTYKFISQASDYASYMAQKLTGKKELTDEEHKNLLRLLEYSKELNDSVSAMVNSCNNGGRITSSSIKSENISVNAISTDMADTEDAFKDYPTLLYDGPFADSVLNRSSKLLETSELIDKEQAREIAAKALDCDVNELSFDGDKYGKIPCYIFRYGLRSAGVTKQGGYLSYILYAGKINEKVISAEKAMKTAEKYLNNMNYPNMASTYYTVNNNVCVINFAYKKDNVTYYSDLIKVGVAMNNGKVVSFESDGYLANHIERGKFTEKIKKETAQASINKYLTVTDSKKCVIPLENGKEAQCYEFHCKSTDTGDEVLVYINSKTGKEENILLLLYSDNGTLTK